MLEHVVDTGFGTAIVFDVLSEELAHIGLKLNAKKPSGKMPAFRPLFVKF